VPPQTGLYRRRMTTEVPIAVTYDGLPISSGGAHSLGRMTRRNALGAIRTFLRECTAPVGRMDYSFTVHDVPDLPRQDDLERRLERRFGRGAIVVLAEDEVDDALDFLDEIHPQPTNQWGMAPIWFRAAARFMLLDPRTKTPIPGQTDHLFERAGYRNDLRLFLDNKARLGVSFCIPDADAATLDALVPWLQQHLPCKLSPKQWRSLTPTKSGSSLRVRVLDMS
jgi:hypothetical protein